MSRFQLALAAGAVALCGCTAESAESPSLLEMGQNISLGDGSVATYAEFDNSGVPGAIGVSIPEATLQALPAEMSDNHHCFDRNGDGQVQSDQECLMMHERVMPLPTSAATRTDIPFKWVLLNFNPMGHMPPGIYDLNHFDIHFVIEPIEDIMAIEAGGCGPEFVRCDQFEIAREPVPSNYVAPDYQNFDAVVPAMGNHLIDVTSPELHGEKFTRTFIYGAYDGRVTFLEEMLTKEFMETKPDTCFNIKQPAGFAIAGYYPTRSCTRYLGDRGAYTVSLEGFLHHEASPPAPADTTSI